MGNVHVTARQQFELEGIDILADASWGDQVNRWGSKPLKTIDPKLTKLGSFTGRGYVIKELLHTLVREIYREAKNFAIILEKTIQFVRVFFQTLFRENMNSWSEVGKKGKSLLNAVAAFLVRPLTYGLDIAKLSAGILVPSAAISGPKTIKPLPPSNPRPDIEIDIDGDGYPDVTIERNRD